MKIQYYHQFFAGPESPGPAQPRKLVKMLADRGNQIEVIACDCNAYNEQDEPEEEYKSENGGSYKIYRLPVQRNLRASLLNRLKTYAGFAWKAYKFGKKLEKPDVVWGTIQPLFGGFAGFRNSKKFKCPFLLEVRDLWPDALVVKGALKKWQAAPLEKMARSMYFGAGRVVTLTPGLKTELLRKGISESKLDLLPNSYDKEMYELPNDNRKEIREKYGWGDKLVAVYTGTHTKVTAVDVMVKAAAELKNRDDIRIDLFGSGQSKPEAIALSEELKLDNIHFHDAVPKSQVPGIVDAADVGLMTLFKSPLIHIYFENKFIDYMGAGKPIIGAMGGVQTDLIHNANAGKVVESSDHKGMAKLIADAADNREKYAEMGKNGFKFISTKLSQPEILRNYCEVLEDLAMGNLNRTAYDPFEGML